MVVSPDAGLIYVSSDSSAITVYTTGGGTFTKKIGSFVKGVTTYVNGEYSNPYSMAVDTSGMVYVVDATCRVQVFKPDGTFQRKLQPDGTFLLCSNPGTPIRVAVDFSGRIYLSMSSNEKAVYIYDKTGVKSLKVSTTAAPQAIALDYYGGSLFVVEGTDNTGYVICAYNTVNGQRLWQISQFASALTVDGSNTKLYISMGPGSDLVKVYAASDGSLVSSWKVDATGLSLYNTTRPSISGVSIGDGGLLYITDVNGRMIISSVGGTTLRAFKIMGSTTGMATIPFRKLLAAWVMCMQGPDALWSSLVGVVHLIC